jgi:hypothetical protein
MYFRGNSFYPFALDWQENSYGRQVIPGLGIYFLHPSEGNWKRDEWKDKLISSEHTSWRDKDITELNT